MRRIVILSGLALTLAAVGSCGVGGDSNTPDSGVVDRYPIAVGSWWEYYEQSGEKSRYDIIGTETVEFDHGIGARTVFLRERKSSNDLLSRIVEYIEDDGDRVVRYRQLIYDDFGILTDQYDEDPGFLKFDRTQASVGDEWECSSTRYSVPLDGSPSYVLDEWKYIYEVISFDELVTVPAGIFPCIGIQRVTAMGDGSDQPPRNYYFADGVGKVKEILWEDEHHERAELSAYGSADTEDCFNGYYAVTDESDLSSLEPYSCIVGSLLIDASGLASLSLPNLVSISGYLQISSNSALAEVDLCALTSVGLYLGITFNAALTDVDLSSLSSVGWSLVVANNDALTGVSGLSSLDWLGGGLEIIDNDALANLDGLNGLTTIGSFLGIDHNDALMNLDGLSGLTSLGSLGYSGGSLFVLNNTILPQCEACDLLDQLVDFTGYFYCSGNQADTCTDTCT